MIPKSQLQKIKKAIKEQMTCVARERDKIDTLMEDLEGLREDCAEAYEHLEDARDAMSRLV